jgi:hypothetical protein
MHRRSLKNGGSTAGRLAGMVVPADAKMFLGHDPAGLGLLPLFLVRRQLCYV